MFKSKKIEKKEKLKELMNTKFIVDYEYYMFGHHSCNQIYIDYLYYITDKENVNEILQNGILRKKNRNNISILKTISLTNNIERQIDIIKRCNYSKNYMDNIAIFKIKQNKINPYEFYNCTHSPFNELKIYNRDIDIQDIELIDIKDFIKEEKESNNEMSNL